MKLPWGLFAILWENAIDLYCPYSFGSLPLRSFGPPQLGPSGGETGGTDREPTTSKSLWHGRSRANFFGKAT